MKSQDLRIGNYVYDYFNEFAEVDFVMICNIETMKLKPIPLTEEWLLKFGFVDGSKTIGNFYISITLGENEIYINDGYGYEGACILSKVKYVHQLQNLYFALTGEELTLSE